MQITDLGQKYFSTSIEALKKAFKIPTTMNIPKLDKITISTSLGGKMTEKAFAASTLASITLITGRKPIVTFAKTSIASFKLREGMPIGYKVTLRKKAMYDFLNRLIYITLPRMKDFNGFSSKALDKTYNFNIGIADCSVFHEIDTMAIDKTFGINIAFTIKNAHSKEQAIMLLKELNMPINS